MISDEDLNELVEDGHFKLSTTEKQSLAAELQRNRIDMFKLRAELEVWKVDAERLYKALADGQLMFVSIEIPSDKKYAKAIDIALEAHRELKEKEEQE